VAETLLAQVLGVPPHGAQACAPGKEEWCVH
jgi:hypothetical protein